MAFDGIQQAIHQLDRILSGDHLLHPDQPVTLTLRDPAPVLDHLPNLSPDLIILPLLLGALGKQVDIQEGLSDISILQGIDRVLDESCELDPLTLRIAGLNF